MRGTQRAHCFQPARVLPIFNTRKGLAKHARQALWYAHLEALQGAAEAPRVVADLRHELISLACAGMTPAQIARQLNCSEKNVYSLLAEAIGRQQLSLEQALDLPEELLGEIQDAFLDGEGELPPVASLTEQFQGRASEGVLHCVRAALQAEFEV